MKTYETTSAAYLGTLEDVYFNYEYRSAPRGLPVREKTDYTFRVLNPTNEPIVTKDLERNKVIEAYTAKETELYNSCSNRVEDFAKASKFWEKLANPDGTVNSAYGHLIWEKKSHGSEFETELVEDDYFGQGTGIKIAVAKLRTPWEWCKQSLIADKDTRQALLRFSLPEHFWVGNKDFTCTTHGNWLIRDDKLHLSVVMRSGDVVKGAAFDWPWFCSLMDKMLEELKPYYPTLTKGHYTHTTHSIHMYEKDEKVVLKMLGLCEN